MMREEYLRPVLHNTRSHPPKRAGNGESWEGASRVVEIEGEEAEQFIRWWEMLTDEEVRIKDASCMAVLTANVVLCVSVEGATRLAILLFHKKKIKKKSVGDGEIKS